MFLEKIPHSDDFHKLTDFEVAKMQGADFVSSALAMVAKVDHAMFAAGFSSGTFPLIPSTQANCFYMGCFEEGDFWALLCIIVKGDFAEVYDIRLDGELCREPRTLTF